VVPLQLCTDNRVSLRSLTYMVRWYNIEDGESISWRAAKDGSQISNYTFVPGLYNFTQFKNIVNRLGVRISLGLDRTNGLIKVNLPRGWLVKFTDGLLNLMGLNDGLNGQ